MTDRILDFSQQPTRLSFGNGLIRIAIDSHAEQTVPVGEVASIIISHPQTTFTHAFLGQIVKAGISLVCCDEKQRPSGMFMPLDGHHEQSRRYRKQADLAVPLRKRIWQVIVRAKICSQAIVLEELHGLDFGLPGYAKRVSSGDKCNVEAHAARRYWTVLFPESRFKRSDDEDARNHLLDYGYAVLRSIAARGLCAAGLHPALGVHHSNAYNTFPLADDIMEPFRPAVDRTVALMFQAASTMPDAPPPRLEAQTKRDLISSITARYYAEGEMRTLIDLVNRCCQQLAAFIVGDKDSFVIPLWHAEVKKGARSTLQNHVADCDVRSAR